MKKTVKKGEYKLSYFLKKSKRAKKIRVSVSLEKGIVATLPRWTTQRYLENFLLDNFSWLKKRLDDFDRIDKSKLVKTGVNDYLRRKRDVYNLVVRRIEKYNAFYGFNYKKISIRNQKTRWGSCSGNKNLNFNYRLYYLPESLVDYVVVHELCHLQEMNHSKNFWILVEKMVPDYKQRRRQLKIEGKKFL